MSTSESSKSGSKDCPPVLTLLHHRHLPRNFVRGQAVVGVQPLNVLSAAQRERLIPGRGSALVLLSDDANRVRLKLFCDVQRMIRGPVVHDDNLYWLPSLRKR